MKIVHICWICKMYLLNVLCGSLRRCRARVCRFCIFAPRSTFSRTRLHPRANHHHHFPLYILTFLGIPFNFSSHLGLSFLGMPLLHITMLKGIQGEKHDTWEHEKHVLNWLIFCHSFNEGVTCITSSCWLQPLLAENHKKTANVGHKYNNFKKTMAKTGN